MCKQNYPTSQFIRGNGPRYLVCARCGVENHLINSEEASQFFSDEIMNARFALFTRRHLPWATVLLGWILYISIGRGIELWSTLFLVLLGLSSIVVTILHFLRSTKFKAELSKLTP